MTKLAIVRETKVSHLYSHAGHITSIFLLIGLVPLKKVGNLGARIEVPNPLLKGAAPRFSFSIWEPRSG